MSSTEVFFEGKYLTFLCNSVLHKNVHCTKAYTNILTLYFVLQQSHQYDVNNGAVSSLRPKGKGHIFLFRSHGTFSLFFYQSHHCDEFCLVLYETRVCIKLFHFYFKDTVVNKLILIQ